MWKSNQRKIERLKKEFVDATDEYEENLHELKLLESTPQQVIATIQQELTEAQGENSDYREKYVKARQTISQINHDYESEKSRLTEENEALQKRIDELQKNDVISKYLSISESFAKETIVKRIREIADSRVTTVSEEEWNELAKVFGNNFPALFHDLSQQGIAPQHIRVCFLTALGISGDEQANMMKTTKQRISNIKSVLNKALFHETSSRTLYKNLVSRYNIYGFEKKNTSKEG